MKARFKDSIMQQVYTLGLTGTYPIPVDFKEGIFGGSLRVAWENGYLGLAVTRYHHKSPAYAAYCAGQKVKETEMKKLSKKPV